MCPDQDHLGEQGRDRAARVVSIEDRLRGLLSANATVTADLSLPIVLRRIVEAARDLLGARYAALGVIGQDGRLEQFVHAGLDDVTAELIGALPSGEGLLGALIRHPEPIRLADLQTHSSSVGFPAQHPPMSSFLGVPVRVGREIFGNLYLTERRDGGEFSAEDEQLAVALAKTAGGAIANARLYAESEQRRRWLAASGELTPALLEPDVTDPLALVVAQAMTAGAADFALVAEPSGPDELEVRAVRGALAGELIGLRVDMEDSWVGHAFRTGKPAMVRDYSAGPSAMNLTASIGPVIVAPLTVGDQVLGVLSLGRLRSSEEFTDADVSMAAMFANQAAVAMQLRSTRAEQALKERLEDHDRIARDLHDHVIGELFAVGMGLHGLSRLLAPPHGDRVVGYADVLDNTIGRIRTSIFQLQPDRHDPVGVKTRILGIVDAHRDQLGFAAHVTFAGALDLRVVGELADDVLAVVREAISNAARHAHADNLAIRVRLDADVLTLIVTDDGRGLDDPQRSSGLTNLRHRAEHHCGSLTLDTVPAGGTRLTWTAHLTPW